jgi:hypothetical protein
MEIVMSKQMEKSISKSLTAFAKVLESEYNVTIKDQDALLKILLTNLPSMIRTAAEIDAESGSDLDELYGEKIWNAVEGE